MWKYQRPGFRGLLLAELQRQQRGSQFCDIVLRAEGVSVPAHSCVLSALYPQLSRILPSTPPPTGQTHLVEFGDVGASTLLRLVGLLYSGEIVGQGEKEREDILSATARLGISGLEEVRDSGEGWSGRRAVGIQTEPLTLEEGGGREGSGLLVGAAQCGMESGSGGQSRMGELPTDANHLTPQPASDFHHNIPYVPLSIFYPLDAHHLPYSDYMAPTEEPGPVFIVPPSYSSLIPTPTRFVCHAPAAVYDHATEMLPPGGGGEDFEQFEGNIAGFINYFLNPGEAECSRGRRRGKRRGGGAGRPRQTRTGGKKDQRPRGGTGRRGRPPKQAAAAAGEEKEAEKSIPPKTWLRRWGVQARRSGRGGGAVGRMLYLNARDHFQPIKPICLKKRGRGKLWKICSKREEPSRENGGAAARQLIQEGAVALDKQKTPPTVTFHSTQTGNASVNPPTLPTELSSSQSLHIPQGPFLAPAPEMLHTTLLPSLETLCHVEQAEQLDLLLDEVMMGLDILDKNNNSKGLQGSSHPHPLTHPATGTDNAVIQQEFQQRSIPTGPQGTASGVHNIPTKTVTVATGVGGFVPGSCEVPVLQQQQGEGGLSDILDDFLLSFEQQVPNCSTGARVEKDDQTCTQASYDASTTMSSSQSQPFAAVGRDPSIAGQSHTHAASTICPAHLEHMHSPHPVQAVMSPIHPQNTGTCTPPPISSKLPPVSAAKPPSSNAITNDSQENKDRILTRRQRRGRKFSPEQPSVARLAEPIMRENAFSDVQPVSAASAVASSVSAMRVPSIPPKAPNSVRKPELKLVIKKEHIRDVRMEGDHNEQAKRPHSRQPQLFSGQCADLKSTLIPPMRSPIKNTVKAYPIRSRVTSQQDKEPLSGEPPLLAKQPTSTPQVVQPIVIKKHKNGIGTVELKTEPDRKDRRGQEIDLLPVDKPVPAISAGLPHHPVEHSDVGVQMEERRDEQKEQGRATSPEEGSQAPERKGDKRRRESEDEFTTNSIEQVELTSTFQAKPKASIPEPHADSQDVMEVSSEKLVVTVESEEEGAVEVRNHSDSDNNDHTQASEDGRATTQGAVQRGEEVSESTDLKMYHTSIPPKAPNSVRKPELKLVIKKKHIRDVRMEGDHNEQAKHPHSLQPQLFSGQCADLKSTLIPPMRSPIKNTVKAYPIRSRVTSQQDKEPLSGEPPLLAKQPTSTPQVVQPIVIKKHKNGIGTVELKTEPDRKDRRGQEIDLLPVDKPVPAISAGLPHHPVEHSDVGVQMEERRDEQKEQGRATSPEEGSQAPERKGDKRRRESEDEFTTNSIEQVELTSTFQAKPKASIPEPHADSQDVMEVSSEKLVVTVESEEEGAVEVRNHSDSDNNDHTQASEDGRATTQGAVQRGEEVSESTDLKMYHTSIPPKAPNSVRKPELKLVIKKKHIRDVRMEGDHNEQAKHPHSLQPQLFSGQCADLKSTLIPPMRSPIKNTVKAYPIRSRVTSQQDKEPLSGESPLLAKQPTSTPQVVQPIVIKKHKNGIRTVELKTEPDRKDRRGQEIDLLPVDKPVPAISAGLPHHPVEHSDVGVQMEERRDEQKEHGRATSPEEGSQAPERKGDKRRRESKDEFTTNSIEQVELTSTFQAKPKASIPKPHADSQDVMEVSSEKLVVTVESEEEGAVEVRNHSDSDNNDHTQASEDGRATTQGAVQRGEEVSESTDLKMKESCQKVGKNVRETSGEELKGTSSDEYINIVDSDENIWETSEEERRGDKKQRESEKELGSKAAKRKRVERADLTVSESGTFQCKPEDELVMTLKSEGDADVEDLNGTYNVNNDHLHYTLPSEEELKGTSSDEYINIVDTEEEGAVEVLNLSDSDNNDQDAQASKDGRATTQGAVQRGEESTDLEMKESCQKVERNTRETSEEELQGPERRGDKRESEEESTTNIVGQAELTSTFQAKPKASIMEPHADSQDVMEASRERLVVTVESEEEGAVEVLNLSDSDNNDQDAQASEDGRATTQGAVQRGEEESESIDLKMEESCQKVEKNVWETSEEAPKGTSSDEYINIVDSDENIWETIEEERRGDKRRRESEEELGSKAAKRKRVEQADLTVSESGTFQCKPEDDIEVHSEELVMTLKSEEDDVEEEEGTRSDEYINIVDSDENIGVVEETDVCLQRRYTDLHNSPNRMGETAVPLHYGITKPAPEPRIPHPPLATEVKLGSTGRRDDEEDDDVDLFGWTSPLPDLRPAKPPPEPRTSHPPLATKVDLGSTGSREDAEDEEEWELDIIGWTSPFPDRRYKKEPPEPQMSHSPLATKVDLGPIVINEEEKDEEEEEVDVIGLTSPFPDPQSIKCEVMLSETEMNNVQTISLLSSPL